MANNTLSNHYIQMDIWLYILGVQFNFYQNIIEIRIISQIKFWVWQFIPYNIPNILQKLANWNASWYNCSLINYKWSFTITLVFGKFCLTTKLDGIVNCHSGYFQAKFLHIREVVAKKKEICTHLYTHKNLSNVSFTVIFVHLDVVIQKVNKMIKDVRRMNSLSCPLLFRIRASSCMQDNFVSMKGIPRNWQF